MKCYREVTRHYWKYLRESYRYLKLEVDSVYSGTVVQSSRFEFIDTNGSYITAPAMSNYTITNGSFGSGETPDKLFDHNVNTKMCANISGSPTIVTMDFGQQWLDTNTYSRWQWYTANDATPARNMKTYRLYGSVDGNTWYKLDDIVDGSYTSSTKALAYTGNIQQGSIPGTSEDYDYYTESYTHKLQPEEIRKYWKYRYDTWTQPVLSANGTMGGSSFAVSASSIYSDTYTAYKAFDNNASTLYYSKDGVIGELTFYNPEELLVESLMFTNRNSGNICAIASGEIYGSNDNSSWTLLKSFTNSSTGASNQWTVTVNNSTLYKYFKVKPLTFGTHTSTNTSIAELKITAKTRTTIAGTESDYDFYTDERWLCGFKY